MHRIRMVIFISSQTSKFISLSCFFPAALIIVMRLAQLVPPSGVCPRISLQFLDYVGIPLTYGPGVSFSSNIIWCFPLFSIDSELPLLTSLPTLDLRPASCGSLLSPPAWIWNYSFGCFESRFQSIAHVGYTLTVF